MKYQSPKIEEEYPSGYVVTVHDIDCPDTNYRRHATADETQQAILYWIADIHARIGTPQ